MGVNGPGTGFQLSARYTSWRNAVAMDAKIPCADLLELRDGEMYIEPQPAGNIVDLRIADTFRPLLEFAEAHRWRERSSKAAVRARRNFCTENLGDRVCLSPRSTLECFYFSDAYSSCFRGAAGLDVGCIVFTRARAPRSSLLPAPFRPTFTPHFLHYQRFGCRMKGIDVRLTSRELDTGFGDIRSLPCADFIVDFITVAMILGPGNPCDSFLSVALGLTELRRVLQPDGLVYIADYILSPNMLYLCLLSGFRVFVNRQFENGIPIGVFLVKEGYDVRRSRFRLIINSLQEYEIDAESLSNVESRNLLLPQPPLC